MNLQGRNLAIETTGDDVKFLHQDLCRLGLAVPEDEANRAFFGQGTQQAVITFQRRHNIEATGVVDEITAAAITAAVEAAGAVRPGGFVVSNTAHIGGN